MIDVDYIDHLVYDGCDGHCIICLTDTQQASLEAWYNICEKITDLKFQVIRWISNYMQQSASRPDVDQLYSYMIANGIKIRRNTLPPRLTELRQAKLIVSEKIKGRRATLNELTELGYEYRDSKEYKYKLHKLKELGKK